FILGMLRLGIIGDLIPATVIKSLLAAVGVIIIVKQVPVLFGSPVVVKNIVDLGAKLPELLVGLNPIVTFIGLLSTIIMFAHSRIEFPLIKAIPGAVWVIIVSEVYSHLFGFQEGGAFNLMGIFCEIDKGFLISLPNEISNAIVFPDFSLWQTSHFWNIVVAIVLVSSIEGILSAKAIDRLDPLKRKSNVNKELSVMGLGTLFSGMIGGLPVIPAIVASSVGINHNAKSQLLDFFQAVAIVLLIVLLGSQLQLIPLAALAGILIHTGYKLLNPLEIKNVAKIGWDQMIIFIVTLIVTLTSDLLLGIAAGTGTTLLIHVFRLKSIGKLFTILFRPNVVSYEEDGGNVYHISVKGYSNFLNYPRLKNAMDLVPIGESMNIDVSLAEFIDHSVMEHLAEYEENYIRRGGKFEIIGLDTHRTIAGHPLSARYLGKIGSEPVVTKTLTSRQLKLQQIAEESSWSFDPTVTRFSSDFEPFHLLRHKTVDKVYNKISGVIKNQTIQIEDVDFHEGEFQTKVSHQSTVAVIEIENTIPLFTVEKEHILDKLAALAGYDDIDFKRFKRFSDAYRLKGQNEAEIRDFFTPELIKYLEKDLPYRLESSGNRLLIFGKERLMNEAEVLKLIAFAVGLCSAIKGESV
ncbi:MAG: SulP family inorganic anion transporter, partial [Flavobacteriales bacterium]